MSAWTTELGAIIGGSSTPWYEPDASFAWSTLIDTDTAAMDPSLGGQIPKTSASAAVAGSGLWDMTSSVYQNTTTGSIGTISLDNPVLIAMVVDKNNHVGSSNTLEVWGNFGVDSIAFGTTASVQPRFVVVVNSVSTVMITQSVWSAKGTALVHWVFFNRTDGTNTIQSGFNSTTTTQSGVVALSSGRSLNRNVIFGAGSGTSGLDATKKGLTQVISRAGMTITDALNIVAKMKSTQGI